MIDKVNQYPQKNTENFEQDRKTIGDNVVDLFKLDKAGKGRGKESIRTIYCVESIKNKVIYLKRPAILNNGFDFEVHAKLYKFEGRIRSRPRHQDIFNLLKEIRIHKLQSK